MPSNYIENWIQEIILSGAAPDGVSGVSLPGSVPLKLDRADMDAYRLFRLRKILQYSYDKSSFYRELFDNAGTQPDHIRRLEDLSKLPLTEPEHLAASPYRFLCLSRAEVARPYTFVTSGTTGPQKKVFWSYADLEGITDFMAAGMGMVAGPGDVVQILLPDGKPGSQADLLSQGVRKLGATPVAPGPDLNAEEQLRILENARSTVIFGYAGRIFRLTTELQPNHDLKNKGLRVLFLAAEYLPDARRRALEEIWNCRVHTHYGLTEMGLGVAVECDARDGYHFNEAGLLLEVVDPRTGNPLPAGDEGELVFTTLTREAMPLIRYRTHDISRLIPEPCPCGAHALLRIDRVRKRLESIAFLANGDELFPALFDDVLFGIPGIVDYQVLLSHTGDRDSLHFRIECVREHRGIIDCARIKLNALPAIARNIHAGNLAEPEVELLGWGSLQSESRAKKMIVDRR